MVSGEAPVWHPCDLEADQRRRCPGQVVGSSAKLIVFGEFDCNDFVDGFQRKNVRLGHGCRKLGLRRLVDHPLVFHVVPIATAITAELIENDVRFQPAMPCDSADVLAVARPSILVQLHPWP